MQQALVISLLALTRGVDGAAVSPTIIDWTVEPSEAAGLTSSRLVSFNLDWHPKGLTWGQNASIMTIDLENPRLRALSAAMSPAYLRIGGSEGDDAVYDIDGACARSRGGSGVPDRAYCLSMTRWRDILHYAHDTGLSVAFGLNVMYGRNCTVRCSPQPCSARVVPPCSGWDPTNAVALIEHTAALLKADGLAGALAGFEVGNEKEHALSPRDYADCMKVVRAAIDRLWPDSATRPLLIGPDENPRADWLHAMLDAGGHVADVVTYHLYAGYGLDPSLQKELVDPGFLDFTRLIGSDIARVVAKAAPHAQIWVGETAAAWHSGEAGITDAFESGFWFVDQLGVLASMSHAAMCRQCFVGGNYSMLGVNDGFAPRPDYWTGLLFKRLMGDTVLTSYQTEPAVTPYYPSMRGYLHCSRGHRGGAAFAFLNTDPDTHYEIKLSGLNTDGSQFKSTLREEFVLSSPGLGPPGKHQSTLSSRHVELNGVLLELGKGNAVPTLRGRRKDGGNFVAPPRTYGFVIYPEANAHACMA